MMNGRKLAGIRRTGCYRNRWCFRNRKTRSRHTCKGWSKERVAVDLNVKTGDELDGAYCVQCNVTDPESVNQMVQAVLAKYGKIDALVNNAGINLPRLLVDVKGEKPEYELNEDSFGKMFAVNVKGVFLCAQAVARELVKQGHGVILNMSSESGKEGSQGQSAYSATKGAVDSFTRSWAKELGKLQCTSCCMCSWYHGSNRTSYSCLQ